jgi:hypothetical protein
MDDSERKPTQAIIIVRSELIGMLAGVTREHSQIDAIWAHKLNHAIERLEAEIGQKLPGFKVADNDLVGAGRPTAGRLASSSRSPQPMSQRPAKLEVQFVRVDQLLASATAALEFIHVSFPMLAETQNAKDQRGQTQTFNIIVNANSSATAIQRQITELPTWAALTEDLSAEGLTEEEIEELAKAVAADVKEQGNPTVGRHVLAWALGFGQSVAANAVDVSRLLRITSILSDWMHRIS